MKYDYHIAVLGAGSGGLVVASAGASLGAKVVLIEAEKMGGDCLNAGCVPSKTSLKSAHLAKDIAHSGEYGIGSTLEKVNVANVMDRVRSVIKSIEPHDSKERYEGLGVTVLNGKGELIDNHTVKAGEKTVTAKNIVIATGSEPVVPPIKGLKDIQYLTNKNIFNLEKLPEHLIIMGGGPIGVELGQGFRHLGSKVTIIDMSEHLFPKDDPEVIPVMEKRLNADGIDLLLSSVIKEVKKEDETITVIVEQNGKNSEITGNQVLVSAGRKPVSYGLGLEKIGVETDERGYIKTNNKLQSSMKNIYACGDVTGPYQFTHMAGYQAGVVIRNIIFKLGAKVDYSCVPWTTYTKPEVAHVGYTEPWAKSLGLYVDSIKINLSEIDRAKAEGDTEGFLKLILGKKGILIGATLVGNKAGEMIPVATLAISQKLKATAFMKLIFSYPTEAEIFKFASLEKVRQSFKNWQKTLIKKIFLR